MTPKQVAEFIKLCKRHNILELEVVGLKLVLNPNAPTPPPKRAKNTASVKDNALPLVDPMYTDEQILMWSSGPESSNGAVNSDGQDNS